ncbi:MAG: hypothetical protein RL662_2125 [Bacteroidota bacterium]|jgi:hypothetical protein
MAKIKIIKGSELPIVEDINKATFLAYEDKTISLKSGRIDLSKMTPLFGVSQEKGQSTILAPSLKLFTNEIESAETGKSRFLLTKDIASTGANILSPNDFKFGYYWHWIEYYYAVNPTYGASQYYTTTPDEILYLANIHSIIYFDSEFKQVSFILNPVTGNEFTTPLGASFFLVNVGVGIINAGTAGVFRDSYPTASFRRFFRVVKESSRLAKYPYDSDFPIKQDLVNKNVHLWLKDAYIDAEYEAGFKYSFSVISKINKHATLYKHIEGAEAGGNITSIGVFSFTPIEGSRYYLGRDAKKPLSWVIADFDILKDNVSNMYYYDGVGLSPRIFSNGGSNINSSLARLQEALSAIIPKVELIDSLAEISVMGNYLASKAESVYDYDTSTFCGWASYIGIANNINGVLFNIKNRDKSALTKVRLRIKSGGYNGAVLADIIKDIFVSPNENKDISFNFKLIENAENAPLWVEYATDRLSTILRIPGMKYPYTPDAGYGKVMYTTNTGLSMSFVEVADSALRVAAWMVWGTHTVQLREEQIENIESRLPVLNEVKEETDSLRNELDQLSEPAIQLQDEQKWESGSFSNQNAISTFSGWGCHIGIRKHFNAAEVCIINRDTTPLTKIRLALSVKDYNGLQLADKTVTVNIQPNETQFIIVPLNKIIENSDSEVLFLRYWCDKLITRFAYGGSYPYIKDNGYEGDVYSTGGSLTNTLIGTAKTGYPFYFRVGMIEELYQLTDKQIGNIKERLDLDSSDSNYANIVLTSRVYAKVGLQTNIYFDNIIESNLPLSMLDINVDCSVGLQHERYFRLTPSDTWIGTKPLSIVVKYNGKVLATYYGSVIIVPAVGSGKIVNMNQWGDSTLSSGQPQKVIIAENDPAALDIRFQGSRGSGLNRHEGRGGWRFEDYATQGRTNYAFNVTELAEIPQLGSAYLQNGNTYTIVEINVTDGTGYLNCEGTKAPDASGVLIKAGGGSPATIAYASYDTIAGNPLWNNGKLDYSVYLSRFGIVMGAGDIVTVNLGINDIFGYVGESALQYKIDEMVEHCREMIAAFKAVDGIKIAIKVTIPCSISQDSFGVNYNAGQTIYQYMKNLWKWQKRLIAEFDNDTSRNNNIFLIPTHVIIDRTYNFPKSEIAPNSRNTVDRETRYDNAVHPAQSGYDQVGDQDAASVYHIVNI